MGTYYDVLGVRPGAAHEDLRRAYIRRALEVHPDRRVDADAVAARGFSEDDAAMQELNAAWQVLGDPTARAAYDAGLDAERFRPTPTGSATVEPTAPPESFLSTLARYAPLLTIVAVLVLIFLFTAYART